MISDKSWKIRVHFIFTLEDWSKKFTPFIILFYYYSKYNLKNIYALNIKLSLCSCMHNYVTCSGEQGTSRSDKFLNKEVVGKFRQVGYFYQIQSLRAFITYHTCSNHSYPRSCETPFQQLRLYLDYYKRSHSWTHIINAVWHCVWMNP